MLKQTHIFMMMKIVNFSYQESMITNLLLGWVPHLSENLEKMQAKEYEGTPCDHHLVPPS